jgi:hypothetical protein
MRLPGVSAALVLLATCCSTPPGAAAHARWPVIGCQDPRDKVPNHFDWRYKPTGLCVSSGSRGAMTGIDHAHWEHWGRRRATARGMLVFGQGFEYPARITAYGLSRTHDFLGQGAYAAWYSKLRVVSRGGYSHGLHQGPLNLILSVVPQE